MGRVQRHEAPAYQKHPGRAWETVSTPRKQGCLEKEKGGAPRMMETHQENTQASPTRPQPVTMKHQIS